MEVARKISGLRNGVMRVSMREGSRRVDETILDLLIVVDRKSGLGICHYNRLSAEATIRIATEKRYLA